MNSALGNVVAITAHPDDAELWMGGTLALHAATSKVTILVATKDDIRRAEAIRGGHVLGATVEIVEHHSAASCEEVLRRVLPDIVVTHRIDDVHDDHREIAALVLRVIPQVVIDQGKPLRLYSCDSYESLTIHGKVEGRVIVDISQTYATKQRALAEHQSQPLQHFSSMAERLGNSWGGRIGVSWAEAFDPIPILGRLPGSSHL